MQDIISRQRAYFDTNATKPISFRIEQLRRLMRALERHEGTLRGAIAADYGKRGYETFITELLPVYGEIGAAIANVAAWSTPSVVASSPFTSPGRCYVMPEPLGVSLVIGPWNYPVQLTLVPAVAALAAGCTVVLKPSEMTTNTSAVIASLIAEAFDPAYLTVVEGGVSETSALLAQRFDMIFFTGSVAVGRIVYQAAAKNLTPVVLELGGKSPTIVTPDANLPLAARRIAWAKFLNAGQTCIAPDYVYVHRAVYEDFLLALAKEIASSRYGLENQNFVQIVNARNLERLAALIDQQKVFTGGLVDVDQRMIAPTVLRDVEWGDRVMGEEVFGPILPTLVYDDIEDVVAQIKQRDKPLALYLFTEDAAMKRKILSELSFGGGAINDAVVQVTNGDLPFGGVGTSGIGSYHGEAGFRSFSHYKSIADREAVTTAEEERFRYSPYDENDLKIMRQTIGIRPG